MIEYVVTAIAAIALIGSYWIGYCMGYNRCCDNVKKRLEDKD